MSDRHEPTSNEPEHSDGDDAMHELLSAERPVPGAAFRGHLGRLVAASDPGYGHRPARLRLLVAGWVAGGVVVAGLGALQALGAL